MPDLKPEQIIKKLEELEDDIVEYLGKKGKSLVKKLKTALEAVDESDVEEGKLEEEDEDEDEEEEDTIADGEGLGDGEWK